MSHDEINLQCHFLSARLILLNLAAINKPAHRVKLTLRLRPYY